jgi:hypothetical protein
MSRYVAATLVVLGADVLARLDPRVGSGDDAEDLASEVRAARRERREAPRVPPPEQPAGAARASRQADSAAPAGSTRGLRGQAALDAIRAAENGRKAAQRRGRVRRAARQPGVGSGRIWPGGKPPAGGDGT